MRGRFIAAGACALLGLLAVPGRATLAATRTATPVRHVSPAGLGSQRAVARHSARTARGPLTVAVTEWVSNTAPVGGDTSCSDPGYATISDALAAAPSGATIEVCTGTYDEQLAITQSVTLLTSGGPVSVVGPASPSSSLTSCDADGGSQPNQDLVDICGSITVAITGSSSAPFSFQGSWPSDVCNDSLYGVAVLGGAVLNLQYADVSGVGGDPQSDGCQGGVGIEVGLATSATTADPGTAQIHAVQVSTYQKNGITVDGAGSSATITASTVTGTGETTALAQNGIQISDGATGKITGTSVSGNECDDTSGGCGSDGLNNVQSAGVLLFDAGASLVNKSTISSNDIGVYNVEDYAWSYYTPPSPFTPVNESFRGLHLTNRYENGVFDAGTSTISGSTLSGGEAGVFVLQYNGQPISAAVTARLDTITGATGAAVWARSDQQSGDLPVAVNVVKNSLDTTNAAGVDNETSSAVTAKKNWWGDATGPSVWSFGTGSSVTPYVDFFPWATTSNFSAYETCLSDTFAQTTDNDVVLCAPANDKSYLANQGSGNVLLLGNNGPDTLVGSATGTTWIIAGQGKNVVNGNNGPGYLQERGNGANDTLYNTENYTISS